MTDSIPDLAARAEATARRVLSDPTIPDSLRQKARELLTRARASRILHGAYYPDPRAPMRHRRRGRITTTRRPLDSARPSG